MIQTGIKLKNVVDFLKEYLSILIVVPAFIGGLWQAIELMNISYSYIRFFSISQIVPDGILIIVFFIVSYSFLFILWFGELLFYKKIIPKTKYLETEEYEKERKTELLSKSVFFVVIYFCMIWNFCYKKNNLNDLTDLEAKLVSTYFFVYILISSLDKCYYYAKDKYKIYIKACNILLFILYIIIIKNFSTRIHNVFISPSNNINIEQVKKDVSQKFPNTKQELLYFNDKYIFIKIIEKLEKDETGRIIKHTKEKVYITKIDNLFIDK